MRESELQSKIIAELTKAGWYVVKLIQTNRNGIPDLLCLRNSEAVFIEVKAGINKPSPLQVYVMEKLTNQKFKTLIAHNLNDIHILCR